MEDKVNLSDELRRLSVKTGFSSRLLEKDYYLTKALQELSDRDINNLVFKGGTCLNKCYLGFYRLSEDLDFVLNREMKNISYKQIKRILDEIRRDLFNVLNKTGLQTDKVFGKGWKMITSQQGQKIRGLEIISGYESVIDQSVQKIKIEVSFRNKLKLPTQYKPIKHEFFDALGEPLLKESVRIESINLSENFAEKIRALVTRKDIAIRDLFDIYIMLKKGFIRMDKKMVEFSISKINETERMDEADLKNHIRNIDKKELREEEINAVLRIGEKIDFKSICAYVKEKILSSMG